MLKEYLLFCDLLCFNFHTTHSAPAACQLLQPADVPLYLTLNIIIHNSAVVFCYQSQAARQGLAVLMASALVVLKNEPSTLRQSHNFIQIHFKFGVSDYVREVTSPAKVGLGPISGRDATWEATYTGPATFFILQQSYSPYPLTNFRA